MKWGGMTLAYYGAWRCRFGDIAGKACDGGCNCREPSTHQWNGHARIAQRLVSLMPFYEYDEAEFFRSDDAPEEIAARRRDAFVRLSMLYRGTFSRRKSGAALNSRKASPTCGFTDAYRVPFQYSRFVRQHLNAGAFVESSRGVMLSDLDGNKFYDLTGSYGVNIFGYDFYKAGNRARRRPRARAGPGARSLFTR